MFPKHFGCLPPRQAFCGFSAADENLTKRIADLGIDPARIHIEPRPRTTAEDALYSRMLLRPETGRKVAPRHRSHAYAARGRMLSCCRISGGDLPGSIYDPWPIGSICPVRYRFLGFEPIRQGHEGVDRPRRAYRPLGKTDALFIGSSVEASNGGPAQQKHLYYIFHILCHYLRCRRAADGQARRFVSGTIGDRLQHQLADGGLQQKHLHYILRCRRAGSGQGRLRHMADLPPTSRLQHNFLHYYIGSHSRDSTSGRPINRGAEFMAGGVQRPES
jgi:hypothetical protein